MGYKVSQSLSTGMPLVAYTSNGESQVASIYITNVSQSPISVMIRIVEPNVSEMLDKQIIIANQALESFDVLEIPITGIVLQNGYKVVVEAPNNAASINIFAIENGV